MTDKTKSRLLNLGLLLVSSAAAIALGEVAVRGLGLSKTWTSYRAAPAFITADMTTGEVIGYRRLPGGSWTGPFGQPLSTNADGFREEEYPPEADSREIRIVWLGDSVTEGYGVARESRFSDLVEAALGERLGRPVRSLNFGVAGHSAVDYVAILRAHGVEARPRVVVVQTNAGDAVDAMAKRDLFLEARWDEPMPRRTEEPRDPCSMARSIRNLFFWEAEPCGPRAVLRRNSALYLALAERWHLLQLRRGQARGEILSLNEVPEETLDFYRRTFKRLVQVGDSVGLPVVAVYGPGESEVQIGLVDADVTAHARFVRVLEGVEGLQVLDLTPALREARNEKLYLDNIHLTPRGHEVAAREILEALERVIGQESVP